MNDVDTESMKAEARALDAEAREMDARTNRLMAWGCGMLSLALFALAALAVALTASLLLRGIAWAWR